MPTTKSVVIIGDSPLAVLIARQVDQHLARLAHIEVTLISRDDLLVYTPIVTSLIGKFEFPSKKKLLREVEFVKATVKQINLIDQRLTTTSGSFDYDMLIIDQTPTFTSGEVRKVSELCHKLVTQLQAKSKDGHQTKARLTFAGQDVSSWQLALSVASDVAKLSAALRRSLSIQAQFPTWDWLREFLTANNVHSRKTVGLLPGATVGGAKAPFSNRLVRGALLDDADNFILENTLNPERHPEVIIIDKNKRYYQNNLRVDETLAVKVLQNIVRSIDGQRQVPIELPKPAGLLLTDESSASWIGDMKSRQLKARLIKNLDLKLYKRLTNP